ncbi:hypothetical protein Avbf_15662 [Armadillidium vulgare]|nr:hypothetical protein Avbf_15662 [Armadillidium vulgare]
MRDNATKLYWFNDGQAQLASQLQIQPQIQKAKNIIYFLADGTSIATFTAARILKGSRSGNYEREQTSWEAFPFTGIIKTYNTDNIVTDSAASSTAYLSGVKANQGTIGVDVNVKYAVCEDMNYEEYHTQSILRDFQVRLLQNREFELRIS